MDGRLNDVHVSRIILNDEIAEFVFYPGLDLRFCGFVYRSVSDVGR